MSDGSWFMLGLAALYLLWHVADLLLRKDDK